MTEDEHKKLICHRSMSGGVGGERQCRGSACTAFRVADKSETVEVSAGVATMRFTKDAGCYCADLKRDA